MNVKLPPEILPINIRCNKDVVWQVIMLFLAQGQIFGGVLGLNIHHGYPRS